MGLMIDRLPELYRFPIIRFLAVGGANFVLVYAVYLVALQYTGYRMSYWISFAVGLFFTSLMNIHHTFGRDLNITILLIYAVYYYGYALVNVTLISLLIEDLQVREEFALLVTMVVLVPIHFFLSPSFSVRLQNIQIHFPFLFVLPVAL